MHLSKDLNLNLVSGIRFILIWIVRTFSDAQFVVKIAKVKDCYVTI